MGAGMDGTPEAACGPASASDKTSKQRFLLRARCWCEDLVAWLVKATLLLQHARGRSSPFASFEFRHSGIRLVAVRGLHAKLLFDGVSLLGESGRMNS
jgi:hypothetical protein